MNHFSYIIFGGFCHVLTVFKYSQFWRVLSCVKYTSFIVKFVIASYVKFTLMGVCHEIFDLHFLYDSNPSRPLMNRLSQLLSSIWYYYIIVSVPPIPTLLWPGLKKVNKNCVTNPSYVLSFVTNFLTEGSAGQKQRNPSLFQPTLSPHSPLTLP